MWLWGKLAIAVAMAALVMGGPTSGFAAEAASEQRREALLQEMLARPNDLDLAFEYAKLSADAGDYEGAISTMERMLIYAPNTPRIQFELGVLYYRLGAYDVSRSYFEQVLANPSVPPDIANQVRLYIQQLSLAADPPPFSASIFSAIRYETNANFGPGTNSVTLNGIDFTLDDQSVGRPGWSALNIGTLHYSYDLKKQGDKIEFDFLAYSTAYFEDELQDIDRLLRVHARPELESETLGLGPDPPLHLRDRRPRLSRLRHLLHRARRRHPPPELLRRAQRARCAARDALPRVQRHRSAPDQLAARRTADPARRHVLVLYEPGLRDHDARLCPA